jgi:hypothetical protein
MYFDIKGGVSQDFSLQRQIDELKKDVVGKFGQIMASTEQMRTMFEAFMHKSDMGDDGSPSINHSALEHQSLGAQRGFDAARVLHNIAEGVPDGAAAVLHPKASVVAPKPPKPKKTRRVTARHEEVTLFSDSEMSLKDPKPTHATAISPQWKVEGRKSPPATVAPTAIEGVQSMTAATGGGKPDLSLDPEEPPICPDAAPELEMAVGDGIADPEVTVATVVMQGTGAADVEEAAEGHVGAQEESAAAQEESAAAQEENPAAEEEKAEAEEEVAVEEGGDSPAANLPHEVPQLASAVPELPPEAPDGSAESSPEKSVPKNRPNPVAKKGKKAAKSPSKVTAPSDVLNCTSNEVRLPLSVSELIRSRICPRQKLLVFNVHGTLVDCNLLGGPNPNSRIRGTTKTDVRRVVMRPWLKPFLSRCFLHFNVAFWGSSSESYMADVVPRMLAGLTGPFEVPLFSWATKHSGGLEGEDGNPALGEKNLSKVYDNWPEFSASNTVIVDSKLSRVACNPSTNVLITVPFYVKWLRTLADDKDYLKTYLWPLLEALSCNPNIPSFRAKYPEIGTDCVAHMLDKRRTHSGYEFLSQFPGEEAGAASARCPVLCSP